MHTTARGKKFPVEPIHNLSDGDLEMEATLKANQLTNIRELAMEHTEEAIELLVRIMQGRLRGEAKASPTLRMAAAKALLEYGHGKPTQQVQHDHGAGGLVVNILRLAEGSKKTVSIDVTPERLTDGDDHDPGAGPYPGAAP